MVGKFLSNIYIIYPEISKKPCNRIDEWITRISMSIDQSLLKHLNFTEIASSITSGALMVSSTNKNQLQGIAMNASFALNALSISHETSLSNLIKAIERSINESTRNYIKSNNDMLNQNTLRSKENMRYIVDSISNTTLLQVTQNGIENEKLILKLQKSLGSAVQQSLIDATKTVEASLTSNFNHLSSVIKEGDVQNMAVFERLGSLSDLAHEMERNSNASMMAYIDTYDNLIMHSNARSNEQFESIMESASNMTWQQINQLNKMNETLYEAIHMDLAPTIRHGLLNFTERVESTLSSSFNKLTQAINVGSQRNVAVLEPFVKQSQKQISSLEIMSRLSDQTLSNALSDLTKVLDEKLSTMISYKPVFDLSHGITREAREKFNNEEREVIRNFI